MVKKIALSALISLWGAFLLQAQQLPFRDGVSTADFIWNPAMTGASQYMEFGGFFRRQWMAFQNAPTTMMAHIQYPFKGQRASVGGWSMLDEAGPIRNIQLGAAYAYKLPLGPYGQLSIGLSVEGRQLQFDGLSTIAADPGDPLAEASRSSVLKPDFSAGLFYVSNIDIYDFRGAGVFAGVGIQQLSHTVGFARPDDTDDLAALFTPAAHINGVFGARFVEGDIFIEPSIWGSYVGGSPLLLQGGVQMEMEETCWAGARFATDYTFSVNAGWIFTASWLGDGTLRVGLTGDYNLGETRTYRGAGLGFVAIYRYWL